MENIQYPDSDNSETTNKILDLLSIFEKAGIASRDRVKDAPEEFHPKNIMKDFQSVIVFARNPKEILKENFIGKFHKILGMIEAQDNVIKYLNRLGYKTQLIGSRAKNISLPRLGERAGIGEISPFNSLVVKGYGLRTVLSAIITDAPLQASPVITDACTDKDSCLKRCPALGADNVFVRTKCTSCGACVKKCQTN